MPDPENKRLLTIQEFSERYGPCRTRVYDLINRGDLRALKCGRRTYIDVAEADKWQESLPTIRPKT